MIYFSSKNPDINSAGKNKFGYIHYSGIILDTTEDDVAYLKQILTDNVNECVSNLKKIQRGQFVLVYSTNDFTIVYTDIISHRRIFEVDYYDNETIFCDDLGLHQIDFNHKINYSLIPTNYIVIYDKNFNISNLYYIIEQNINLKQDIDSYEPLFTEASDLLDAIYKKFKKINLSLSEGHDSGFVNLLCLNKNIPHSITHMSAHSIFWDYNNNNYQSDIFQKRVKLFKKKFPTLNNRIKIENPIELKNKCYDNFNSYKEIILKNNFITNYNIDDLNTFIFLFSLPDVPLGINILADPDYVLFDAGYLGKKKNKNRSKFGGIFPKNLGLHHTWWLNHNHNLCPPEVYLTLPMDYLNKKIYIFYGTKSFLLEYMKLDRKLKSNQNYKPFIKYYFDKYSYPYIEKFNGTELPS